MSTPSLADSPAQKTQPQTPPYIKYTLEKHDPAALQSQAYAAENMQQFQTQSDALPGNPLIPNYGKITNDNDNIMNYRTFVTY